MRGMRPVLFAGVMALTGTAQAADETVKINFSIAETSADLALIDFAKQADLTIVFPFDKVRERQAKPLVGEYDIPTGIHALLEGTGLVAEFGKRNVITIKTAPEATKADEGLLTRFVKLFTDDGENIITYPEQDSPYELILVKGIRGSMQRAMDIKQSSTDVVDAIRAEDIGKFPDLNLAESLQRITGVSIDRAEGEGQFVTVRGFGPQFNSVLINGRRLATDNQGREFSFDTLASELVSGVSVHKTFAADQGSGGIGSTINIETARPLNARGFKVAGTLKAMYDTNSEETTPQGSVLLSHANNEFGWLLAFSRQERDARINEVQTDGWLLNTKVPQDQLQGAADNIFVPRNYDQRVRFDTRTRTGGTLVLQYRPSADLDISFDYLRSRFDVETRSTSMGHWFTSSNLENVVLDANGTAVQFEQRLGHATDFHARTFDRPSDVEASGLNVRYQATNNLQLTADLALSEASVDDTGGRANALSLIGYLNRSRFDHSAGNDLPTISGFDTPSDSIPGPDGQRLSVGNYLDPANGRTHVMLRRGWDIRDRFDQFRFDGRWDGGLEQLQALEFGLMLTRQHKRNDRWDNEANAVHCTFCGYFPEPDIPDSFQQVFDAGSDFLDDLSGHESLPTRWLQHDQAQLFAFVEAQSGLSFDAMLRNNSFSIEEDVTALYVQSHFEQTIGDALLNVKLGLRFEDSQIDVRGLRAELLELTILDQTELGPVTGEPERIRQTNDYQNWLPSVSAKLAWADNWIARGALSRSLTRPTMSQMSPSITLNTTRQGGDLRASSGNPALQPFESTNLDLAVEYYFGESSYLSANYFRKRVDNFIIRTVSQLSFPGVTDPSTGSDPTAADDQDAVASFAITQPINGETATVDGWELAFQHQFDSGFGVIANMTLVDSNAELDRDNVSQVFALTGLSDSQNLVVFYEQGPAQMRLAYNHRDGFLQSLVQIQGGEPTFVRSYQQLDMSASYALNDNLSVFVEGINLTEENLLKHGRYDNQLLLAQDTGARYTLGIRGSF